MSNRIIKETALTAEQIKAFQAGIMSYTYKGIPTLKCPMDMALYMNIIWEIRPATIIEIGSFSGGSAIWLADVLENFGLQDSRIFSFDINPVKDISHPRISFRHCDLDSVEPALTEAFFESIARPILLIEDASHMAEHTLNVLNTCHPWLSTGDYIIVEDGIIHHQAGRNRYNGGPLKAIEEFMAMHGDHYEIDRARCDYYGTNVTWNVDGYIRRVK